MVTENLEFLVVVHFCMLPRKRRWIGGFGNRCSRIKILKVRLPGKRAEEGI